MDPGMYNCDYPIHFELQQGDYEHLLEKANDYAMDPSEFIKWIVTEQILSGSTVVFISEWNKEIIQNVLDKRGFEGSFEKALSKWIIETAKDQESEIIIDKN